MASCFLPVSSPPHLLLRLTFAGLPLALATALAAPQPTEYELKAVYLFHFTEFVSWPEASYPSLNAPFVIGIVGNDPFGTTLDEVIRNESVGAHPIVVRHVEDLASERGCRILFVSHGYEDQLHPRQLGNAPILTVGESQAFAQDGGMVEFVTERNRIHLRIDLASARAHGLGVSAKLLRVAEVTGGGEPETAR